MSFLNKQNIYLLILSIGLSIIFIDYLFFIILSFVFLFFIMNNLKPTTIISTFVLLVVVTSGFGETIRFIIQILTVSILLILFLKDYGLDVKNYPSVSKEIILLVAAILLVMILSLLFTEFLYLGVIQVIRSIFFFLIVYLYFSLIKGYYDLKYFIFALYLGAFIYFGFLFFEIISSNFDIINLNQTLLLDEGTSFIHRNAIGSFFSICILITLAFLMKYPVNRSNKIYLIFLVSFMILALVLTNSRAAILTLLVGVSFIFFKENKKYLYRLFLAMIIGLSLLLIEPISDALNLYLRLERISTGRDYILETVFNIISNNPIIGAGPAASKFEMYNYLPYMFGTHQEYFLSKLINQIEFGHAHNFYLFFYTDLGILGFVVSLAIPYVFFKLSSKIIKKINNLYGMIYPLVLGIQASGIALFLRGIFEWGGIFSYGTLSYDLPFWWIFIMLIFIYQKTINVKSKIYPIFLHNS